VAAQDERLAAIAAAAAAVLRQTPYHVVRAGDVAAALRLPGQAGRSAVWLYNEVHNRRVLVALAAAHAWREFAGQASWSPPGSIGSVTAARSAAVAALGVIVAFHRAEQSLMTQVGFGIGDISTAEKRKLTAGTDLAPPSWPDSAWGRVAAAAWHGRCDVFTDFLRPVLRDCAESVTQLAEPALAESASRLSDIAFRTCLADREGPVDLLARGLAALWLERDLTRLAGALPRDLESAETALAAVARRRTDPRADRRSRFLPTSYRVQEDLIWLAKAALVLRHPRTVLELLAGQTAETDWFRDQVSFRLGYTARRLLALASGELGRADEAAAALLASREELGAWPLDGGLDPLAADFDRSLAELALLRGEAADAASALTLLADAEAEAMGEGGATGEGVGGVGSGPPLPAHGWTLVLLGRAAARLGDTQRAAACFRSVTDLAAAGIDPCHPVILTARYDEAERCTALGDTRQAAKLLAPVLDRTLLAHGRPALGEAHPLLTRARALAERLGITVPYPASDLDEASLDIDV
jgi:hypothetical protein